MIASEEVSVSRPLMPPAVVALTNVPPPMMTLLLVVARRSRVELAPMTMVLPLAPAAFALKICTVIAPVVGWIKRLPVKEA